MCLNAEVGFPKIKNTNEAIVIKNTNITKKTFILRTEGFM